MLFYPSRLWQFPAQGSLVPLVWFCQLLHQLDTPRATSAESSAAAPNITCSPIPPLLLFPVSSAKSLQFETLSWLIPRGHRYSVGIPALYSMGSQTPDLRTVALRGKQTHFPLHLIFTKCLRTPMGNQICFCFVFWGILIKRSCPLLSMNGDRTQNEMSGICSWHHTAPEYNELGKGDWHVKINVLWEFN